MRFIHTADWQMGMRRRWLDEDAQARYQDARLAAVARAGDLAARSGAAFLLAAGDVFESNFLDERTVRRVLEMLRGMPVPVYLLPGNHDPLDPASIYRSPLFRRHCPRGVTVLEPGRVVEAAPGVELVGAPWQARREAPNPLLPLLEALPPPAGLRIVAAHGDMEPYGHEGDPARIPLAPVEAALDTGRLHYLALGHRHSRTAVGQSNRIWYSGSPEPTDFDEVDPGQVLLVDVEPEGVRVEAFATGTWHFVDRHLALDPADPAGSLRGLLDSLPDRDRTVLRLSLEGEVGLEERLALESLIEEERALFAAIDRREDRDRLAAPARGGDPPPPGLTGFAAAAWAELAEAAREGDAEARYALGLFHRLVSEGRPPEEEPSA
ncbi:DNA repair exonuclease [Candidatus Hydrogenisulfobacillus filiaventi]|uniref:Nuclease SbcCD subunit D n=1 Tax=Candidatus Hydrogenisulfobacillus filiaventi TaxID=2707344 RepID=A0A6F8ZC70_9FIRM|nr:DNA repair exonuclease [Bacillota bacterium]CAB1127626.1 DNA repair exonuclease [Candidatus Hydrogenisulfobacillus filiaventi]